MGRFMIVSKADKLDEYTALSREYDVAFEVNDFFEPEILDDRAKLDAVIEAYLKKGLPEHSTIHGAFYDIAVFSRDARIREMSEFRMEQSMLLAEILGASGVVFHTNYNPALSDEGYMGYFVDATANWLTKLLEKYPAIDIYMENMFDTNPGILKGISEKLERYNNYGVCLDWAHVSIYGSPADKWVEELVPYVKHIHINDNDLKRDLHLPVGSGMIDWKQFAGYYNRYFQNCSVLVETNEPLDQRGSLEYIRREITRW